MDTDDLPEETYSIIADAHRECGLLGAQLAVAGAPAGSEREFLDRMNAFLVDAAAGASEYWEGYEEMYGATQFRKLCRALRKRVIARRDTISAG